MASASSTSASGTGAAVMYLKPENAIVLEDLRKRLDPDATTPIEPSDVRVTDFDGKPHVLLQTFKSPVLNVRHVADVKFRIEVPEEELNLVKVSINVPAFADLRG